MLQITAFFLFEEKLFINWCLISKVFRHEKCSYSVRYGREKPNLHSNLHAHVEYKSQHIQHNSTILIKKILFVIKEKIKVICNNTIHILLITYPYTWS